MIAHRTRRGADRRLARLAAGLLIFGLGAPLAVLHGVLLWDRIANLTLLEPVVAARWAAAALVVAGLLRLRRAGLPLLRGRRAMVFWVLALFLHLSFSAPATGEAGMLGPASGTQDGVLVLLPFTAPLALAAGIVLLLLASRRAAPRRDPPGALRRPAPRRFPATAVLFPALFSRPPPLVV